MASTLIVRDATLAINGPQESRSDPRDHLRQRIVEVRSMTGETVAACAEVLHPMSVGEDVDLEVLEAMTILGLSRPSEAERLGVSPLASGRKLASRLEQSGKLGRATAVLEVLLDVFPNQGALERDLTSLMRRQGMVEDLIDRYYDRAQRMLREGKTHEAMSWLREILLLDGSRKDVARLVRNLRLRNVSRPRRQIGGWLVKFMILVGIGAGLVFLGMREVQLREEFKALAPAQAGDLASLQRRLDSVEEFLDEHPIWHGTLFAVGERSGLRVEIDRLEQEAELRREASESLAKEREESANLVRARARGRVESGDLDGALEDLRLALELAPVDWEFQDRVKADIAAIAKHLEGEQ